MIKIKNRLKNLSKIFKVKILPDPLPLKLIRFFFEGNTRRPPEVSTALIRRYFATLTRAFEYPLERYVTSLMPLKKQINPFKPIPSPNPFDVSSF